jgi:hypothetical protein
MLAATIGVVISTVIAELMSASASHVQASLTSFHPEFALRTLLSFDFVPEKSFS